MDFNNGHLQFGDDAEIVRGWIESPGPRGQVNGWFLWPDDVQPLLSCNTPMRLTINSPSGEQQIRLQITTTNHAPIDGSNFQVEFKGSLAD